MALLGALVADQGRIITPGMLNLFLLANPADIFRMINLTSGPDVSLYAGMTGAVQQSRISGQLLLVALLCWIAVPLALASLLFGRREL
jgi:Cu-processing system permease protein